MSEPKYNIAILLATRGRDEMLGRSVRSLVELADDVSKIQLMFAFDNDDTIGLEYFSKELKPWLDEHNAVYTAMQFKRMGYVNLHKYSNTLAKSTDARWLIIWNDDAVMETKGWDSTIMSYEGQFKLLSFKTHKMHPYSIFPIVPRKWFDILGYLSPHPSQDAWVSQQAYMLDIYERIDVSVLHDRFDLTGNNKDEMFDNRPMLEGKPSDPRDFHSVQMLDLRHKDCVKLAGHMQEQNLSIEFFQNVFKGTQDPWEKLAANDINGQMMQFQNPHEGSKSLYDYNYFNKADGIVSWKAKTLKFGDAFPALCYAHGITWQELEQGFPNLFTKENHYGQGEYSGPSKLAEQIAFIKHNAKRTPKRVLEIGGGRGEVAQVLKYMGIEVVSIEPGAGANQWYKHTANTFFGLEFDAVEPVNKFLHEAVADLDFSTFDTILMVESLEHIPADQFDPVWEDITKVFHGLTIMVNWVNYHPIAVGQYASAEEHCRLVDDVLYDKWTTQAEECVWRNGSHLVLKF